MINFPLVSARGNFNNKKFQKMWEYKRYAKFLFGAFFDTLEKLGSGVVDNGE